MSHLKQGEMAMDHHTSLVYDALERIGVHLDDINALRLLEPDIAGRTNELKNELRQFVDSKSCYVHVRYIWHATLNQLTAETGNLMALKRLHAAETGGVTGGREVDLGDCYPERSLGWAYQYKLRWICARSCTHTNAI